MTYWLKVACAVLSAPFVLVAALAAVPIIGFIYGIKVWLEAFEEVFGEVDID